MSTHLLKPGSMLSSLMLRCGLLTSDATDGDFIGSEGSLAHVDCAGCLRDLVADLRAELLGAGDSPEARWIVAGDAGISSITIWSVMTGWAAPHNHKPNIPHDPADFGRCHRMLERFPTWRGRLPEVAARHPDWAGLVARWGELTALYLDELPTGSGPKTWALMRELREKGPS